MRCGRPRCAACGGLWRVRCSAACARNSRLHLTDFGGSPILRPGQGKNPRQEPRDPPNRRNAGKRQRRATLNRPAGLGAGEEEAVAHGVSQLRFSPATKAREASAQRFGQWPSSRSKPAAPTQSCQAATWLSFMPRRRCSGPLTMNSTPPIFDKFLIAIRLHT